MPCAIAATNRSTVRLFSSFSSRIMSKRNVSFVKPEEPSFLKKLKQQIGFKEGPTIETKRAKLSRSDDDDDDDRLDDQPAIVVLKPGDLTAEEVDTEKKRLEIEEEKKPADLNQRVIFKPTGKKISEYNSKNSNASRNSQKRETVDKRNKLEPKKIGALSFNDDEEDEY